MNAKDKAKELVRKFKGRGMDGDEMYASKECALIAVDEIIKANPIIPLQFMLESEAIDEAILYWQEVKSNIQIL